MNIRKVASLIAHYEGKKAKVSIGNVREILRIAVKLAATNGHVYDALLNYLRRYANDAARANNATRSTQHSGTSSSKIRGNAARSQRAANSPADHRRGPKAKGAAKK